MIDLNLQTHLYIKTLLLLIIRYDQSQLQSEIDRLLNFKNLSNEPRPEVFLS